MPCLSLCLHHPECTAILVRVYSIEVLHSMYQGEEELHFWVNIPQSRASVSARLAYDAIFPNMDACFWSLHVRLRRG